MLEVLENSLFAVIKLCWVEIRKKTEDDRILSGYKYSSICSLTNCLLCGGHWVRSCGSRREGVSVS